MIRKSREGKRPPTSFFAAVTAYLSRAYPDAPLTNDALQVLEPWLVAEWQRGQNAEGAAKATCACDGFTIVPSPASVDAATGQRRESFPRGTVRAPKGAKRPDARTYALEEVRESRPIVEARLRVELIKRDIEHYSQSVRDQELAVQTARPGSRAAARAESMLQSERQRVGELVTQLEQAATAERGLLAASPWVNRRAAVAVPQRKRAGKGRKVRALPPVPVAVVAKAVAIAAPKKGPCTDCQKRKRTPTPGKIAAVAKPMADGTPKRWTRQAILRKARALTFNVVEKGPGLPVLITSPAGIAIEVWENGSAKRADLPPDVAVPMTLKAAAAYLLPDERIVAAVKPASESQMKGLLAKLRQAKTGA